MFTVDKDSTIDGGKPMKNLDILIEDTKDVLDELNIPYGPIVSVTINYRAKSRWGYCKKTHAGYEIQIASILMKDDVSWESAMNTMIHEFLHAHKNRMCHTGEWKRLAELVNREFPQYHIERTTSAAELGVSEKEIKKRFKYSIVCNRCGITSNYMRKTQTVSTIMAKPINSSYRCSSCGCHDFTVNCN